MKFSLADDRQRYLCKQLLNLLSKWRSDVAIPSSANAPYSAVGPFMYSTLAPSNTIPVYQQIQYHFGLPNFQTSTPLIHTVDLHHQVPISAGHFGGSLHGYHQYSPPMIMAHAAHFNNLAVAPGMSINQPTTRHYGPPSSLMSKNQGKKYFPYTYWFCFMWLIVIVGNASIEKRSGVENDFIVKVEALLNGLENRTTLMVSFIIDA